MPGFAVNNMQYAVFTRAWAMVIWILAKFAKLAILPYWHSQVSDGIISVDDVDKVVSEGFGMRLAFFGSIANLHMNADG